MKHAEILNLVEFAAESEPSNIVYTQATRDTIHKGVYDYAQGWDVKNPHKLFLNDTLITETRHHTPAAVDTIIEALYVVLCREKRSERRSPISMDTFTVHKYS